MGQARIRGSKEERVQQAIELTKTQPPKHKKLNQRQIRERAGMIAAEMLHNLFTKGTLV